MPFAEDEIEELARQIRSQIRENSLDGILRGFRTIRVPAELIQLAKERFEKSAQRIIELRDPAVLEEDREIWYAGPGPGNRIWPPVSSYLRQKLGSEESHEALDRASTRVVACLANPHREAFSVRGLVAGDVQSGKTSNFTAVIAKAVDAGYGLVIVLSGTKSKLRRQTQSRLEQDLVQRAPENWFLLTSEQRDFAAGGFVTPAGQVLVQWRQQSVLAVVKKNARVLAHLRTWLAGTPQTMIDRVPVLVIDDEADEASINARNPDEQRAAVNNAILEILRLFKKCSFVGYTATPYANFLIDTSNPEDLYPRDFILNLTSSRDYFGYEKVFGRERTRYDETDDAIDGLDMIRLIEPNEAALLRPARGNAHPRPDLGQLPALSQALGWFVLCTAARAARGQGGQHSSMLIHTSQRIAVHRLFEQPIRDWLTALAAALQRNDAEVLANMRALWELESSKVDASIWNRGNQPFDAIAPQLAATASRTRVIVENGMTPKEERLVYGEEGGSFVVIGGDVLSRGLTLEGLGCSYFVRSASTYDTLMQMGRWFGYRRGFEELPRIWMTGELKSAFYELGAVDREMRQQIDRTYRPGLTPRQFAPMIRRMPGLAVTSRMKMQARSVSEVRIDYGGRRVQTILFHHQNRQWLLTNQAAARQLVSAAVSTGTRMKDTSSPEGRLLEGASPQAVLEFLGSYQFHEQSWNLDARMISSYIRSEQEAGGLSQWSILVSGMGSGATESFDLGVGGMRTIIRSRMNTPGLTYANIKSLMSLQDAAVDMLGQPVATFEEALVRRASEKPDTGLLILYPIDRASPPRDAREGTRAPLDALEVVIGVGMVFPPSVRGGATEHSYVTQRFEGVETVEQPDDELLAAD